MDIWEIDNWKKYYDSHVYRKGLRVYYHPDVHFEVKRSIKEFIAWIRETYEFPKRIRIYVKPQRRIKAQKGDFVCGTFFRPADRTVEPYIRIATGDYLELVEKRGMDNALASILWTVAHELTHYFQWLNDLDLTFIGEERQATSYANRILDDYAQTRDHP